MISQPPSKPGMNVQQHNPDTIQNQRREIAAFTSYHLNILFPNNLNNFTETIWGIQNNPTKSYQNLEYKPYAKFIHGKSS